MAKIEGRQRRDAIIGTWCLFVQEIAAGNAEVYVPINETPRNFTGRQKTHFDAAHAFGCSHQGRMIGGFGQAEVFSFQATKFFNTLEGGAVATNDDALATRVRRMKDFGFSGLDTVVSVGTNAKMNEISAAMGLGGLLMEVTRHNRIDWLRIEPGWRVRRAAA